MTDSGMPFMVTSWMKEGLRHRGHADAAIFQMTPQDAYKALLTPDPIMVREFFEVFTALAQRSLGSHLAPGYLQMSRKSPTDNDLVPTRYKLDSVNLVERLTHDALTDSEAGHNVYIEGRLVSFNVRGKKRGELKDTSCVFALVVDSDADRNMAWSPPAGLQPTLIVETSPGNAQYWFFLKQALSAKKAQSLGERIRKVTGCDADSGNVTQPYRVPGTVNYPDRAKRGRGRVIVPTRVLAL
jgi:RepB DNA-primase from phage plasmid